MELVDSHCHFDVDEFDADREAALHRARERGVVAQVLPAVIHDTWPKLRAVCQRFEDLHATYGLHPVFLAEHRPEHLEALAHWLDREPAVAVGECGLDFFVPGLDHDTQVRYFTEQLRLARQRDLPVIVHARRAVDQVIKYIRRFEGVRGVVHSFAGSEQQAHRLLDLGFLISLGGPLTYQRARRLHRVVKAIPLTGLMLETDAPDQPGCRHRGERNEPAYLPEVLETVARLRGEEPAHIAAVTTANARRLFGLAA